MDKIDMPISPPGGPQYYISGCRLTQAGYTKLSVEKGLKSFRFDINRNWPAAVVKKLMDIPVPFYVNKKGTAMYIFSEQDAFVINLCGSVESWLKQL